MDPDNFQFLLQVTRKLFWDFYACYTTWHTLFRKQQNIILIFKSKVKEANKFNCLKFWVVFELRRFFFLELFSGLWYFLWKLIYAVDTLKRVCGCLHSNWIESFNKHWNPCLYLNLWRKPMNELVLIFFCQQILRLAIQLFYCDSCCKGWAQSLFILELNWLIYYSKVQWAQWNFTVEWMIPRYLNSNLY